MCRHATQALTLGFRARRVGTESNPAAPVYVKVVETTAPTDVVEVELTLPAGAYTVQAKAHHWLREEMSVVSSVPWIFAAPTGANKVTVYCDEVPGATGYRVLWGTQSGVYPHSSAVLPADARQWSITGLVTEQTCYVVVQAEYNGLWGPPSEEDSAIPHVGAIPWDSRDATIILHAVRAVIGDIPAGHLDVLAPDGRYYTEDEWGNPMVTEPPGVLLSASDTASYGTLAVPLTHARKEALENTGTGPYRRVRSDTSARCIGAIVRFYLPPEEDPFYGTPYIYIHPTADDNRDPLSTMDTPCVYLGIAFPGGDFEAGVMFHPAGREGVPYSRWQPYGAFVPAKGKRIKLPLLGGDPRNPKHHIPYVGEDDGWWGYVVDMVLLPVASPFGKVTLFAIGAYDVFSEGWVYSHWFVGFAPAVPLDGEGVRVRRVHSIAQKKEVVKRIGGYKRTGSFVLGVSVDYLPLFFGVTLDLPAMVLRYDNGTLQWQDWIRTGISEQPNSAGVFPFLQQKPLFTVNEWVGGQDTRYFRETVSIDLRP
jgi:hypothetical protein